MVKISLPIPSDEVPIKHFLKQLELSVHHCQKAFEQMEKDGLVNENTFVAYRHPKVGYDTHCELYDSNDINDIELEIESC